MTTENKPHIVFSNGTRDAFIYPDYLSAYLKWCELKLRQPVTDESPWLIYVRKEDGTRGRMIDPSSHLTDCNE